MDEQQKIILTCPEHSGCIERIKGLEHSEIKQWDKIEKQDIRINGIFNRINVILCSVITICLLLIANLIIK